MRKTCKDLNCQDGCRKKSEQHDAYFCSLHDKWLEKSCKDHGCEYCRYRPARPSECTA